MNPVSRVSLYYNKRNSRAGYAWSYFSSDMVVISLISSAVTKVGQLFVNTQISATVLI